MQGKAREVKKPYEGLPAPHLLDISQASHFSCLFTQAPQDRGYASQPREQKHGEIPGTTCNCRGCTGKAPAQTHLSLGGFPEPLRSPEEAPRRHSPQRPRGDRRATRAEAAEGQPVPGSGLSPGSPLLTPGPGRRCSGPERPSPQAGPSPGCPQPTPGCASSAGEARRGPSQRSRRPHARHRPSRSPRGRAHGRPRAEEPRGYHAAQADVLVVGEDEHHVGPPRLPGCPRGAQHQQRGQRQPPGYHGGGHGAVERTGEPPGGGTEEAGTARPRDETRAGGATGRALRSSARARPAPGI